MESLKESLDELFEEYQSANKNPADSTLEEGMQKVIKWDKERQMLLQEIRWKEEKKDKNVLIGLEGE